MIRTLTEKTSQGPDFDAIRISLASPEKILSWSHGEVIRSETINYRTFKPERDGLFCARIFGPVTDWECLCGKYKRMKHRGVVCDKCGVEVTESKVRRERFGHIKLASPCSHVWYVKSRPSPIALLLDMRPKDVELVLYFESHIVVDPGDVPNLKERELISADRYRQLVQEFPGRFLAKMGAEAIKELLRKIPIDQLSDTLRNSMKTETSQQKRLKYARRLKVVEAFRTSGNRPEWMILDVIPVIAPELRPIVPLDSGRFATSDLNDLYRRVINRNNRLSKQIELKVPEVILSNEKRMLQEVVDTLFDNGRRGRIVRGANNRPLRSLSDTLNGKEGRLRRNLLGKRVDYSGRSVIVPGPELRLHQCGLPQEMALELFKPFVFIQLETRNHAVSRQHAADMVRRRESVVWRILEEVTREHPVLLNRQPTLHRLGIQAFEPVLVNEKAIRLHPLVCAAFGADFDGDQMAVYVPLSPVARTEARTLLFAVRNILSPTNGQPIANPAADIVLGCYELTRTESAIGFARRPFASVADIQAALDAGVVNPRTPIRLKHRGDYVNLEIQPDDQDVLAAVSQAVPRNTIETTVGRAIFNTALPDGLPYINATMNKSGLASLVALCYRRLGQEATVALLDALKTLGFHFATRAGFSIGIDDLVIASRKPELIEKAERDIQKIENSYSQGAVTDTERRHGILDIWTETKEAITAAMFDQMRTGKDESGRLNPIQVLDDSGARGSKEQFSQLSGMRGLMTDFSGALRETPIRSSFREGLTGFEYFSSASGSRKGFADRVLQTPEAGYLTRRLVDVAHGIIVTREDCETSQGIRATPIVENGRVLVSPGERILGRVALDDVVDPETGRLIVPAGSEISEGAAEAIGNLGSIESIRVRSPLSCTARRGICARCYGRDLATGRLVGIGQAVGVVAAQSIGEPGTQLTLRTVHSGGAGAKARVGESRYGDDASPVSKAFDITGSLPRLVELFEARTPKMTAGTVRPPGREPRGRTRPATKKTVRHASDAGRAGDRAPHATVGPSDILAASGIAAVERHIVDEIQTIYRRHGVTIDDKHIEIIVRQMLRWVRVTDVGDTMFGFDEIVDRFAFEDANEQAMAAGGRGAVGERILLGITKASLLSESFISAASFREATRVLAEAAVAGRVDHLRGLKENVIVGKLIPAGSAVAKVRPTEPDDPSPPRAGSGAAMDLAQRVEPASTDVPEE